MVVWGSILLEGPIGKDGMVNFGKSCVFASFSIAQQVLSWERFSRDFYRFSGFRGLEKYFPGETLTLTVERSLVENW